MDKGMTAGILIGIGLGFGFILVVFHYSKPAMEVATVNYIEGLAAQQLGGQLPAQVVAVVQPILTGAVHAAFAEIPI